MSGHPSKVIVLTNADCIRRKLDAELLRRYFMQNGFRAARTPKEADLILLVTCSYKHSKEDECFEYMEQLQKRGGELIVAGCLPEIAPERFKEYFKGRYVSTKTIEEIDKLFPHFQVKLSDLSDPHFPTPISPFAYSIPSHYHPKQGLMNRGVMKGLGILAWKVKESLRPKPKADQEAFLRVGYGCVGGCAYCAINRAVGKLRSKPLERCCMEYRELIEEGYRRIVLVSDNIGAYGMDFGGSLTDLLERLSHADHNQAVKWDIRQIAPKYVIRHQKALLKYAQEGKLVNLHCPAQSGSPHVLSAMNRDTNVEGFVEVLKALHEAAPALTLKTELIIGFPSETEERFEQTLNLFRAVPFTQSTLFAYSDVHGTPASNMPDKVDRAIALNRIERARALLRSLGVETLCDEE